MRRIYVIDTSALISNPSVFKSFPDSQIIIPIAVLNELDKLKKGSGESSRSARVCIRLLDQLSEAGDISQGVLLEHNILLKIDVEYLDTSIDPYLGLGDPTYGDTQILACAQATAKKYPDQEVVLVSNDINLRIKAKARGLKAIECQDNNNFSEIYTGNQKIIQEEAGLALLEHGIIDPKDYGLDLFPQECILFQDQEGDDISIGRKVSENCIKQIRKVYPWDISARNLEQTFAIDLLMDKNIDLVTMSGFAGTGKTLIALSCALELLLNKREYEKLIIYRPIREMGNNEIGFLPGTFEEKISPHFQAIYDCFEILLGGDYRRELEMYQKKNRIECGALSFIRGRSINNAIIFVDEIQNLGSGEVKTILTRAGIESKIILGGDISQIDTPHLDATNNGLIHVINKFKNSEIAGHINFIHGERSRLATLAADIL